MNRRLTILLGALAASFSAAPAALGQAVNFSVSYALSDGNLHALTDGTTITFPSADVNANTTASVTIQNLGTGTGVINAISVTGTGFQLVNPTLLPANVAATQTFRFGIVFAPNRTGSFGGTFHIDMTGRSVSGTLSGSTPPPAFSLSYIDPDTSNVLPLANNATLTFPKTLAGSTSSIAILAANSGTGTGLINSIALSGNEPAFQLLSLPPLPVTVPPSQQLRFGIRFSPQQTQIATDIVRLDLNGQIVTINLQAQGTQPQFTYRSGAGVSFVPGDAVAIVDTAVGQTSSLVITVSNTGTGDGQVSAIGVTGQGLSLSGLPTLPFTLHPNASQQFTLNFAPTQPGAVTGRLTIGNDSFTVAATGIGSRLIFSYTSASASVPVLDGGVVIFPPLAVGSTSSLSFSIQNTGTSAATISSINLAAPTTVFVPSQLPSLPINLNPGASVNFPINFIPNTTGSLTATLRVNTSSFTLSGNGTQPASLAGYRFQGPSGTQPPAQQPAIGLTLVSPYASALQGTLKLTFVSAVFTDDPSIQFASGGRTVNFTIPANTTQALFSGNATTVPIQTGTTAGNIVITPSFAMQVGFDLTPSTPDVLTLTIARTAPQLLNASITGQTATGFTVALNGFTTTRAMRQLDIDITPKSGQKFSSTHLTVDVSSAASAWFQSTTSQGFGGSFLVAIPFVLSTSGTTGDLVHLLQSLSITATNEVGASSSISVPIP